MEKTAKPINKFMFLFILHQIFILVILDAVLVLTGARYDLITLQIFFELLTFLPPLVLYIYMSGAKIKDIFYLKYPGIANILLAVVITLTAQPILYVLSSLAAIFFPNNTQVFVEGLFTVPLEGVLIVTAVLPAIFEESIFRGLVFNKNLNLKVSTKVLLSSLFFALMHLEPQQLLYTFAAGVLFAYLMYITRSIFSAMIAHFSLNSFQTLMLYINMQASSGAASTMEVSALDSLLVSVFLMVLFLPFFIFSCYLLIINNRHTIAAEKLFISLKMAAARQSEAGNKETAHEAVSENTASKNSDSDIAGEKQKRRGFKRKIFTWEFWGVIIIYVLYVSSIYYLKSQAG